MEKKRIILGYPLDLLLNRECLFCDYEEYITQTYLDIATTKGKMGGIELPPTMLPINVSHVAVTDSVSLPATALPSSASSANDAEPLLTPGTGNIIIRGKPGTAKSTLALQIAVSAAQVCENAAANKKFSFNSTSSLYISLEESAENVMQKAELFGWKDRCEILDQLNSTIVNKRDGSELLESLLLNPKVLISTLSPRNIHKSDTDKYSLYIDRYQQIETILKAAKAYNVKNAKVPVGFVIIDSINVFGDGLLSRNQLFRLFDLFKRYRIIGIFIVEEDEKSIYRTYDKFDGETLEYISDLVISLTVGEDEGYSLRYFEITKSRYKHQVYGKHPFKLYENRDNQAIKVENINNTFLAFRVFPSLHYLVYGTDNSESNDPKNTTQPPVDKSDTPLSGDPKILKVVEDLASPEGRHLFCDSTVDSYLSRKFEHCLSVLIAGPRDTNKTTLARDFLMKELLGNNNSHVLFISFQDYCQGSENLVPFRITVKCQKLIEAKNADYKLDPSSFWANFKNDVSEDKKANTKRFLYSYVTPEPNQTKRFTELIYQTGYITAEEFIHILLEAILVKSNHQGNTHPTCLVIDEIGRIGSSYPLLLKSKTAGELFLSALFHIIENYRIKFVITGTTGDYSRSDDVINKVKTLVNDIITTKKINVFGDNFITIQGGRISSSQNTDLNKQRNANENIPGAIIPRILSENEGVIEIDKDKFIGLVGFDSGEIYRPGMDLYLFSENSIQTDYNNSVVKLLNYAFNTWAITGHHNELTIENKEFDDKSSSIFHSSLKLLQGKPIRKTVICMIDEFFNYQKEVSSDQPLVQIDSNTFEGIFKGRKSSSELNNSLPYYDNVLVLVYNKSFDNEESSDLKNNCKNWSFKDWLGLKEIIELKINEHPNHPKDQVLDMIFETDETFCCLLLDVLFSSTKRKKHENNEILLAEVFESINKKTLVNNLLALRNIIKQCGRTALWTGHDLNTAKPSSKELLSKGVLNSNSMFYICWYSQLRYLISQNPELSSKLEVFPLPGGGFTGDWRVALLKGSVSENLGLDVLKFLCNEEQDYKRFVEGVGLPTKLRFYLDENNEDNKNNIAAGLPAWINSNLDLSDEMKNSIMNSIGLPGLERSNIRLPQIFKLYFIHSCAHKRSDIKDYLLLRNSLFILFKQLIMIEDADIIKKVIKETIVDRMPGIFKRFSLKTEKKEGEVEDKNKESKEPEKK